MAESYSRAAAAALDVTGETELTSAQPLRKVQAARSLKIAILGYRSHPYGGGQGIYIKYLSKALVEAGHEVNVISGEPYPHLDDRVRLIKMPGMNLYENGLGSIRARNLTSWADMVEWFSKLTGGFAEPYSFGYRVDTYLKKHGHQYDLIHDNQSLSSGMLSIQQRLPTVTTLHHPITSDLEIALNASTKWWERLLIRRWHSFLTMQTKVVQKLDNIVTVSERSKSDISDAFGIDAAGVELIYCGINTDEFSPRPSITRKPRRLMATASADQPLKGLRFLLRAYAQLLSQYPDLELLVVGKPKPGGDTEKLLHSLKISDKVQFVSGISTEEMVDYYAEATVAVVPSVYEGFGLPAGEAMACEVPVVSTNGGALTEVVGDAGVIVPVKDADAIASAVADLLENPDKARELGQAGRQRILERFCWNVSARKFVHYYHEVISEHANR
ncbi:GDP-mannose-dependent alpha-(1-6)-phosphatidylinositol monomannoside mannosyltransferase [BD1-7 clade bacterium]|uniref:GDP-mannose-dependent alpha-(1-6)-phosphatidylinositol monomannoside mannosyltransferase n=1 Tax=BD1-7 clade bacterium TaxID=2029982 RepID=A0A5S9MN22_9GAMM|nr:GDP-mannose-dependent alpha-(1-6)-phosphatidylinositol monomannoside mannosyltransferase [BD1-7 clade bacterium]CAA0085520.1 GDP-mannose-dependent alpha-(1-6)-phosphatidylinositol monomannoside mannosyltransferase [BD1-7 clade bacterium]